MLLVETREAGVQGSWSHDGEELPATCQSSCGHMHALVLPGVTREDAGEITFSLGNSRTTTLLRVKCESMKPSKQEGQGGRVASCWLLGWPSGFKAEVLLGACARLRWKSRLCLRCQAQSSWAPCFGGDVQRPKEHGPADLEGPRASPRDLLHLPPRAAGGRL